MDLITLALAKEHTNKAIQAIQDSIATVYKFRGNINTATDLEDILNPSIGDVYNILDTNMNVAWTGENWDELGTTVDLKKLIDDIMLDYDISTVQYEALQRLLAELEQATAYQNQLVNLAGFMWFEIDENGHLIFTKSPSTNIDFEISEHGHLIVMEVD